MGTPSKYCIFHLLYLAASARNQLAEQNINFQIKKNDLMPIVESGKKNSLRIIAVGFHPSGH